MSDLPGILVALPTTLEDPRRAWPVRERSTLPGPAGVALAAVFLLGGIAALGTFCVRGRGLLRARLDGPPDGARWARPADLTRLLVRRPVPGRLTLGRLGRRLVAAEPRVSTIVFGPSQSGKTTGLAIPAILEAAGPVLAVSVKSDLVDATIGHRGTVGHAWVFDPTRSATSGTSRPNVGWDPVHGSRSWADARRTAHALAAAQTVPSSQEGRFWQQMAIKLIAPHLLAAATTSRTMRDVVRWLDTREEDAVFDSLTAAGVPEAVEAFEASCRRDERTRSSVYASAEALLEPFADPQVAASIAESAPLEPSELLGGRNTLFVVAPASDQERLAPLFAGLVEQVLDLAYRRAADGHPCIPPLTVILDEAANTAPIRSLPQVAATAAGQGIQVVTIFQDLAQARVRYGESADTLLTNHRAKLFLSGISDQRTLDHVRHVLGEEDVEVSSLSTPPAGGRTETRTQQRRALAPPDLVRGLKPGNALLIYGHLPPARLSLRRPVR
ncbi:MAG: type IV secretory system conjugative DNA transfer family protein [Thermoleophilia bacterium]